MEDRAHIADNGREENDDDYNLLGDNAGLADDRVFAELFRLKPWDGSSAAKGVLPYSVQTNSAQQWIANSASALSLDVQPFRAFIGSRTAASTDGKTNWRDIRSGISVGSTTSVTTVAFTTNTDPNPRWDLLYAQVSIDSNVTDTRYRRDPSTGDVASGTYVTAIRTSVSLPSPVVGTPAASPTFPALPADAGSNYNIPLAYVRVRSGATSFTSQDILEIAPVMAFGRSSSAATTKPADYQNRTDGLLASSRTPWPASGNRPPAYVAPSASGQDNRFFLLDFIAPNVANADVLEKSVNWLYRYFRWEVAVIAAGSFFASDPQNTTASLVFPRYTLAASNRLDGWGESFSGGAGADKTIFSVDHTSLTTIASGATVAFVVDGTTGNIKLSVTGSPACLMFVWIEGLGQFGYV